MTLTIETVNSASKHEEEFRYLLLFEDDASSEQRNANGTAGEGTSSSSSGLDGGRHDCLLFLFANQYACRLVHRYVVYIQRMCWRGVGCEDVVCLCEDSREECCVSM
jgi:hypothetical protein